MSDFSQALYEGDAKPTSRYYMNIDPINMLYGANLGLLFVYGVSMYAAYPGSINGDPVNYPERTSNACEVDQEWALATNEITAWTNASLWHAIVYGWGFFAWGWNTLAGGSGGYKHQLFYQTARILQLAPFVSMIAAINVKKSYAPTSAAYQADIAWWEPCQYTWLYNVDQTTENSFDFMSDNQRIRQWFMWLGAAFSLATNVATMEKFTDEYEVAKMKWDIKQEEEEK